jgi:hypothetical protein
MCIAALKLTLWLENFGQKSSLRSLTLLQGAFKFEAFNDSNFNNFGLISDEIISADSLDDRGLHVESLDRDGLNAKSIDGEHLRARGKWHNRISRPRKCL